MKHVAVTSPFFVQAPYVLIENIQDVKEYAEEIENLTTNAIGRIMSSNISMERFDHYLSKTNQGDGILLTSFLQCKIKGGNPLIESGSILHQKILSITTSVMDGEKIIVNPSGGYTTLPDDWDYIPVDKPEQPVYYHIAEKPSLINLENDPELEEWTKKYFESNNLELSFVKELRKHDLEDLTEIFKEFKLKGGYGLYVYTTGLDIPQMYEYCDAACDAGLTKIVIDLNAGEEDEHIDLFNSFKDEIDMEMVTL
jgi:hypothetical protein